MKHISSLNIIYKGIIKNPDIVLNKYIEYLLKDNSTNTTFSELYDIDNIMLLIFDFLLMIHD